jgi:hypothetical protein
VAITLGIRKRAVNIEQQGLEFTHVRIQESGNSLCPIFAECGWKMHHP